MGNHEANCQTDADKEYDLGDYVPDPAPPAVDLIGELLQHIYLQQQVIIDRIIDVLAWRPYILGSIWAVSYLVGLGTGLFVGWMLLG